MPHTPAAREQPGELFEARATGEGEQTGAEHQLHHHDQNQRRHSLLGGLHHRRDGQTDQGTDTGQQGDRDEQFERPDQEESVLARRAAAA